MIVGLGDVGRKEGEIDGRSDGNIVGFEVLGMIGALEGLLVGEREGDIVRFRSLVRDGARLAISEGEKDTIVSDAEGTADGKLVGNRLFVSIVGKMLGDEVGKREGGLEIHLLG